MPDYNVTVHGVTLRLSEAGKAGAPPVLLMHGFPQDRSMWRDVTPTLARTRRVISLDLRGAGESEAPRHGYSTTERVADVVAVLDALGLDRVDVVGHDWGAWLGYRIALDHPDRVRRLVAIAMVHPWPMQRHLLPNVWRWWVTALFEVPGVGAWVLRRHLGVASWLLTRDSRRPDIWSSERLHRYVVRAAEPARASAGRQLHTQLIRDIPRLLLGRDRRRTLEAPTLVVGGEHDALIPPAVLTVPARLAGTMSVRTLPGGHFLVDEIPELVAELVDTHLGAALRA